MTSCTRCRRRPSPRPATPPSAQARKDGDRATATELAALKRPTQAAWLVNLLALRRPDVVADLIELGATIRAAQGSVPPTQLRDLSAQRRKALDAALAQSHRAGPRGRPAGPDPGPARRGRGARSPPPWPTRPRPHQVRSGRVLKPLRYCGFGDGLVAATTTVPRRPGPRGRRRHAPRHRAHRSTPARRSPQEDEAGRPAARRPRRGWPTAERTVDETTADERAANAEVDRLTADLAALRERARPAHSPAARAARQKRIAAERDHESAQRRARAAGA